MGPDANPTRTEGGQPNRDSRPHAKSESGSPAEISRGSAAAGPPQSPATNPDLQALVRLDRALLERDYAAAARQVRECLATLPRRFRERIGIHPLLPTTRLIELEQGGTAMALVGDEDGLNEMRRVVESVPGLERWIPKVAKHQLACDIVPKIEELIRSHPICMQRDMKHLLGVADGHLVNHLLQYLEKDGRLVRVRSGRTWRLLPPDSREIPEPEPPKPRPKVPSHRTDRTAPLRPVDLSSFPRIALPQALAKWELVDKDRLPEVGDAPLTAFEVRDADWRSPSVERLPPALRPDPAIRRFFPSNSGVLMTTEKRRWTDFGDDEARALHYDHDGRTTARRTLPHGIFRAYCPPFGSAVIGISQDGVLHALDEDLRTILETPIPQAPEVTAWKKTLPEEMRGATGFTDRIAISADAGRYLFALNDRVHCVDRSGSALWSRRFPDARWFPAADYYGAGRHQPDLGPPPRAPSRPPGASQRISLSEDRRTICAWHPPDDWSVDRNLAELEMQRARWLLTEEFRMPEALADDYVRATRSTSENLAGDESGTPPPSEDTWRPRFIRELSRRQEASPYGICEIREVEATDSPPITFVHEVAFSSSGGTVFVATSEGAVWALDEAGSAVRAYIGLGGPLGPPCVTGRRTRRIVHIDDYLYLMTEAQLFVLARNELQVVLDVLPREEMYHTPNGFGLLSERRIRWYGRDGTYLGAILAKHPIRRLYRAGTDTVVETRTERAVFSDIPVW